MFVLALASLFFIDTAYAMHVRQRLWSRRKHTFFRDTPTGAYGIGVVAGHLWIAKPVLPAEVGLVAIVLLGGSLIIWEFLDGSPVRWWVALLLGLGAGAWCWP